MYSADKDCDPAMSSRCVSAAEMHKVEMGIVMTCASEIDDGRVVKGVVILGTGTRDVID